MVLDAFLGKDLLLAKPGDAGEVTEKAVVETVTLITAVSKKVPVSKKGYLELLRSFTIEVQSARHKSEFAARNLADQVSKVRKLEFKVQLLDDDVKKVDDLQGPLSAKEAAPAFTKLALEESEATLKAKERGCGDLSS